MAGTELAKAYVQIIPSAEGIKQQLTNVLGKEVGGAGDEAGKSLGNSLISAVKPIIAAAGIGSILKEAFSEGANLQQSLGGVETLFKENADKVKQYANEAYKTAGLSANEYMESVTGFSASLLQSLGGDTAMAAEAANMALIDMSDNANKMGTSMEMIQNAYQGFAKQNYTMLDNLKLGYGGTKTEMERLLADAKELSGVDYNIDNLNDVYEAIHVIQTEMDITGTTAKEGASTFSGALASMKAAATNLLGKLTLGEDIRAELHALQETFQTFFFENLIPMLGNIASNIPTVMDGIIQFGIQLVTKLAESIRTNLPLIWEKGTELIANFVNGILDSKSNSAIIDSVIQTIAQFTETILSNLPQILESGIQIIAELVAGIIDAIPKVVSVVWDVIQTIREEFSKINWLEIGKNILEGIKNGLLSGLGTIGEAAKKVGEKALNTVKDILGIASPSKEFFKIGEFVTEGFVNGISKSSINAEKALQKLTAVNMGTFEFNSSAGQGKENGHYTEVILELARAISENPTKVVVTLEGDAKRLFRVMQLEAKNNQALTGQKA